MKTIGALFVVSLFGCSASRGVDVEYEGHGSPCMQQMGVRLEMRNGRPVAHVQRGCADSAPALVHEISFANYVSLDMIDLEARPILPPLLCQLSANSIRSGDGDFPAAGWEYGVQLGGYTLSRPCEPLQAGHRYYASVIGSGVGGVVFDIGPDGGLNVADDECTPAKPRTNQNR